MDTGPYSEQIANKIHSLSLDLVTLDPFERAKSEEKYKEREILYNIEYTKLNVKVMWQISHSISLSATKYVYDRLSLGRSVSILNIVCRRRLKHK